MLLIRKNPSSILGFLAARSKNFTVFSSPHFLTPLSLFTSQVDPFIVKFLIDSVGLTSAEAAKASKSIAHIKTPSQPDSVLKFFRKNGFTDTDIKRIVSLHSRVLCCKVDSTLKLKLDALRELGFSEAQIIKLITANPVSIKYLNYCNARPRIEFLSALLGSNDEILKALSKNNSLLARSFEKKIMPNIAFLRECQFSDERICALLTKNQKVIGRALSSLKSIAMRVDELGFSYKSRMFYHAFCCLCKLSSDVVDAKIECMGSLGFSKAEIVSTILKQPYTLCLSVNNLRDTVDFLVKEVGCSLSYVSRYPSIMRFSLTKRLIPRNCVMQLIREKGLLEENIDFYQFFSISNGRFLDKFIFSFQEKMPDLPDAYLSASVDKFLK